MRLQFGISTKLMILVLLSTGCTGVASFELDKSQVAVPRSDFYQKDTLFTPANKMSVLRMSDGQVAVQIPGSVAVTIGDDGCVTKNAAGRVVYAADVMATETNTLWGFYGFDPEVFCFDIMAK